MRHLFGKKAIKFYAVLVVAFVILGSTLKVDLVWNMSDMFNGLMVLPNLIGLLACATDSVGNARIKPPGRAVGVNGSAHFPPDFLFGNIFDIDFRTVDTAYHSQFSLCDFLNFNNIILGDHPLPDIHADLHHICHNRLADAVRVVYIDHAAFMDGIRDFLLQRFDNRPPDSGRQKQILFGTPVVMIEDNIRMYFFSHQTDIFYLIIRDHPQQRRHFLRIFHIIDQGSLHPH